VPVIYYIRHGETQWNAEGRLQGAQDIPLNELGRKQAVQAGRMLGRVLTRDGRSEFALDFVASPLSRARSTMELVLNTLRLPPDQYAIDDRLREIGYGHWEGATLAEAEISHPELYVQRQAEKWIVPPPGGESYLEVQARVNDWYRGLTSDTVAVAHGGTGRALMVALGIEPPKVAAELVLEQGAVYVFSESGLAKYG
jgi:probable phosphoglycerate mutase